MRLEPMSVPVVASGPNGSVVAAGNWVTGTRELNDAIVPSLEIQSDGYLQHIDARGSISGQRKLPPLWMQSVLQNDAATFILEQEDDPDASSLSFRLSVRIVGLDARPERHVSLTTSGSQVAGPMVALPDGGIVVGAPFGVIEADAGSEESSQFIWLAADGSPRFTREVVGATRTFSINDGLAMVATAKGSIAVALRCLGETRLLQAGPAPTILPGTEFTKETHDLCLWHYDQQGQAHGAQRLRRLGYLSIATLIEVPNGELWLLGNADDRAHLWRFDAAWTARGELPIPDEVSSIQDLVVLSNRDILALVALKNSGFALAQLPKPGTPAETPK